MILKYLTNFRLLLYIGFVICIILVTTNYLWLSEIKLLTREENATYEDIYNFVNEEIRISEIYPNCGLRQMCPDESFPVHIYTGQNKDDQPRLCVQGKYLGGGGRGLNVAVIETRYLQLVSLQNFDLYSQNSSALETWLEHNLRHDDIIIAFTFDEASKELSKKAKAILYHLGSGKIQDLQYRSQWYMISQKGINGFTPLETITYARNDRWGEVINERLCVPKKIVPLTISPDPFPRKNQDRDQFCSISKQLGCLDFCNSLARHEPIVPSLLTNRSLIGNTVFSTPFIVISGKSIATLALTLETLVYQPGLHSATVFVIYEENQPEVATLAKIFGFKPLISNLGPVRHKINFGLKYILENFPKKKYAIVIEEGLILSPDYLFYLAQTVPILEKDNSLLGVSAWNPYGYESSSGSTTVAYRVEDFPGLGFIIRMDIFNETMKDNMDICCQNRSFTGWPWVLEQYKGANIIMPDVSRVLMRPREVSDLNSNEFQLFKYPRLTNVNINAYLERPQDLVKDRYFQSMANLIQSSITIHLTNEDLKLCQNNGNIAIKIMLNELKNKIFAIYYREKICISYEKLKSFFKCFEIYTPNIFRPQNMYQKIVRFDIGNNIVLLIEATSPFAKNKQVKFS